MSMTILTLLAALSLSAIAAANAAARRRKALLLLRSDRSARS
ncbi:hypothetical protein [Ahrensia marina]|nr:hypothetical protein [Ahrensia marina]